MNTKHSQVPSAADSSSSLWDSVPSGDRFAADPAVTVEAVREAMRAPSDDAFATAPALDALMQPTD